MKYLTDSEIMKWAKELNLPIYPRYSNITGQPDILISEIKTIDYNPSISRYDYQAGGQVPEIKDVNKAITYKFTFSVSKNRVDTFNKILKKKLSGDIGTKIIIEKQDGSMSKVQKSQDIKLNEFGTNSVEKEDHVIFNREFTRFTYTLYGQFSYIMIYVSYIEEVINYIASIWGYNDEGEEILLTKYSIGDIVSPNDDKSLDYLILDYVLNEQTNKIDYMVSDMIFDKSSSIIRYNSVFNVNEESITWSRNSRIDDILN
jgi:hypothetical protein